MKLIKSYKESIFRTDHDQKNHRDSSNRHEKKYTSSKNSFFADQKWSLVNKICLNIHEILVRSLDFDEISVLSLKLEEKLWYLDLESERSKICLGKLTTRYLQICRVFLEKRHFKKVFRGSCLMIFGIFSSGSSREITTSAQFGADFLIHGRNYFLTV